MGDNSINIPFSGLKEGAHEFKFHINGSFFKQFEDSEIKECDLSIDVILNKLNRIMELEINMKGTVDVMCDVCLDNFDLAVKYSGRIIIKFGKTEDEDDEVLYINENASEIKLGQYIYESIHLSLPYKKVHPVDKKGNSGCNMEMIKKLNLHRIEEEKKNNDPRWDNLKNLMFNN